MQALKHELHEHQPAQQQAQPTQRQLLLRQMRPLIQQTVVLSQPHHQTVFFRQMV